MKIFFTTSSLKKYIIGVAPTLKGLFIDIKNRRCLGVRIYIVRIKCLERLA